MKTRLDRLLVQRGLAATRERAQALILAGRVLVNEQKFEKPGAAVSEDAKLRLLGEELRYVSRGGLKLEAALAHWHIDVTGRTCMDVGASTGGFTDCLLQHGAGRVIAVDTGYGQMDMRLRSDARVRLLEKTNARYLTAENVGEPVQFLAMDVSFISATLVLPAVMASIQQAWTAVEKTTGSETTSGSRKTSGPEKNRSPESARLEAVVLVKPQFEAGREHVGKGGIVRDVAAQQAAVDKVRASMAGLGFTELEAIDSPIRGAEGNREFLLHGTKKFVIGNL
jgi:23S rRNA (cytidine1920-2'-O)/16S rRNA (cytidine1409-2'-O)-methyltransferase